MPSGIIALLSFVTLGSGHAALGQWSRTLAWFFVSVALMWSPYGLAHVRPSLLLLTLVLVLGVAVRGLCAWSAYQSARHGSAEAPRRSRAIAFALATIGVSVVANTGVEAVAGPSRIRAARVASGSMAPTLDVGDYFLHWPTRDREVHRDQLLVYARAGTEYVHRVGGLAGDTVSMISGVFYRNGKAVEIPGILPGSDATARPEFAWQQAYESDPHSSRQPNLSTWGPLIIPPGAMFMLGDNRDESFDSRFFGFGDVGTARATPVVIYFSRDPDIGLRWSRFGKRLLPSRLTKV